MDLRVGAGRGGSSWYHAENAMKPGKLQARIAPTNQGVHLDEPRCLKKSRQREVFSCRVVEA